MNRTIPDPSRCVAESTEHGRITHWYQCQRKPTTEIDGYKLCGQHARKAKIAGKLSIVVGPKTTPGYNGGIRHDSAIITFKQDADLLAASNTKEAEKERVRINRDYGHSATVLLLKEFIKRHPDTDLVALYGASNVDVIRALDPNNWAIRTLNALEGWEPDHA